MPCCYIYGFEYFFINTLLSFNNILLLWIKLKLCKIKIPSPASFESNPALTSLVATLPFLIFFVYSASSKNDKIKTNKWVKSCFIFMKLSFSNAIY